MIKKIFKNKKGFTLVESLVAISIFTLSILTLLVLLGGGISDSVYLKQKMVATYLAQEGIEYIRNMKDTYVLFDAGGPAAGWTAFHTKLFNNGCAGNGCYFNDQNVNFSDNTQPMTDLSIVSCPSGTCPTLLYQSSTGRYNYIAGGSPTTFTRKIWVSYISATELRFMSAVFWTQKSGTYNISFVENLTNWAD